MEKKEDTTEVNNNNDNNDNWSSIKYVAGGAGIGGLGALGAQGATAAMVPTLMSTTGTVVAGVGTFHSGLTASAMVFASAGVTSFALPVAAAGAVAGGAYYLFSSGEQTEQHEETQSK
eukprot:CAMPEP_0201507580 /NCGR_PEP_ID=MMETSP0161_2-20130828/1221_1 /ASSEMBLY_ACC=CAM_ASM_000251 /TAXON_ID=180227 /ORGANISM="Neoparamoeba aestuarina, Strain SoJaBio B1-5/56/2" /LENGTH=117 /DNA_ID=CAMNT_0047901997 /DNA_START=126 /DNA_END=479 /DNA_ORIENTATION=+